MEEKQKSAVDYILDNLHYLHSTKWDDITEKARLLFEEQIKDACRKFGNLNGVDEEDFEQYYDNTFKSEI